MANDWNKGIVPYKNQKNYNTPVAPLVLRFEHPKGESQTIPGEAMTIKQIMDRAMQGLNPDTREVEFFDIQDINKINAFPIDLTDLQQTREELDNLKTIVDEAIAEANAEEPEPEPDPPPTPEPTPDPEPTP